MIMIAVTVTPAFVSCSFLLSLELFVLPESMFTHYEELDQ